MVIIVFFMCVILVFWICFALISFLMLFTIVSIASFSFVVSCLGFDSYCSYESGSSIRVGIVLQASTYTHCSNIRLIDLSQPYACLITVSSTPNSAHFCHSFAFAFYRNTSKSSHPFPNQYSPLAYLMAKQWPNSW